MENSTMIEKTGVEESQIPDHVKAEIEAMESIVKALEGFDDLARARMLQYIVSAFKVK